MSEAPKVIWSQESASGWEEPIATIYQVDHFPKYHHDDTVTALQAKVARLEAALEELSCRHVTKGPLWWQSIARKALEETQ
ncbi:MAG: hypothetical protein GY820_00150 [Gammaproteobacteria bacterium]|nr:hypothetical protein [Gammaproteobacteria bacterium]